MNMSYYLPVNSSTIPHYFGRGIILSSKHFENKVPDIQNKAKDSIILCTSKWVKNTDACLELVLTDNEEKRLSRISNHFYSYPFPLPISRVKSVFFLSIEQSKVTVWNTNSGAGFIPERIVKVDNLDGLNIVDENEIADVNLNDAEDTDVPRKVKYYNHLLGAFALMRVAGEEYSKYSENYFTTLANFNIRIQEEVNNAIKENKIIIRSDVSRFFSKKENKWTKLNSFFYQQVSIDEVERVAASQGIKVNRRLGIPSIEEVDHNSTIYDLLMLTIYGNNRTKSIDTFVSDIINGKIPEDKKEILALLIGLNNGYSGLRNKYKISKVEKITKYQLISKLDYYTIESIFQFAFYSERNNSNFPYIDSLISEATQSKPDKKAYRVVDEWIISKKKPQVLSQEYCKELLESNPPEEVYKLVTKSFFQWLPPFVTRSEEEGTKYFKEKLQSSIYSWASTFFMKLREDSDKLLVEQNEELPDEFNSEVESLKQKNWDLHQELLKTKEQLEALKAGTEITNNNPVTSTKEITNSESSDQPNATNQIDYSLLDLKELQRVAKEKNIKPIPKKKEDLIKAIKANNIVTTFL